MDWRILGVIILVFGIVCLAGTIYLYMDVSDKQDQYDENHENGEYYLNNNRRENDQEEIDQQTMFTGACFGLFFILFIVGAVVIGTGERREKRNEQLKQQTIIYQQPTHPEPTGYNCQSCGKIVQPEWMLCPNCGAELLSDNAQC